jgi:hypothetical protein
MTFSGAAKGVATAKGASTSGLTGNFGPSFRHDGLIQQHCHPSAARFPKAPFISGSRSR